MDENEEVDNFEKEIDELATLCLAAMNRSHPDEPIIFDGKKEKSTFESKYLSSN